MLDKLEKAWGEDGLDACSLHKWTLKNWPDPGEGGSLDSYY